MTQIYVALTKEPIYDANLKANLYARGVFKSDTNIVEILQLQDKNITRMQASNLPFPVPVSPVKSSNTAYIIDCDVSDDCKKMYILQVTITDKHRGQTYVYCNSNENELFSIMMEWLEEESEEISDEAINCMTEDIKKYGHHDFFGYGDACGFMVYYYDLETELNE